MGKEQELRLLPCPFCGWKEPKIVTNKHANMSWVACADCGLETPSETGTSAEDAAEYWNRRSSDQQAEVVGPVAFLSAGQFETLGPDPDDGGGAAYLPIRHTAAGNFQMALYASLPVVAAGGVTEEMVEAACAGFEHGVTQQTQDYQFKQLGDGWLFRSGDWINVSDALRAALNALPTPPSRGEGE